MNFEWSHITSRLAQLIIVLLMVVCSQMADATTTTSTVNQATQARMETEAEQEALQGNFAEASKRYETLAAHASKADRDHLILKAAWYAAQSGDVIKAQSLLDDTNKTLLGSDGILRTVVTAALALRSNQIDHALDMLDQIPLPMPDEVAPDELALRS